MGDPQSTKTDLERLKRTIPIRDLVEARGVKLVRHGADWHGRCPFHSPDRTPSLVVSPKKNLWHCLGACQTGGSVIDWVMKAEGLTFMKAVERLSAMKFDAATVEIPSATEPTLIREWTPEDQTLINAVAEHYHQTLKATPTALAYVEARGLIAPDVIDTFKLGYSNNSLEKVLPSRSTRDGIEKRKRLEALGILRRGQEHFVGSIVIPILDPSGNVLGLYGRRVIEPPKSNPAHRYLPGPHRGVFNEIALKLSTEVILCESLIDALTFWCAGFRNVTTSYGVEGFTPHHLAAMKRHCTECVLIAYDRDLAGDRAAIGLADKLKAEGIACHRVEFPKGMDANELALTVRPAVKSLGLVLDNAAPMLGALPRTIEVVEVAAPAETPSLVAPGADADTTAAPDVSAEIREEEIVFRLGERRYRVRGLFKNTAVDVLKINVLASKGDRFFVDTFDLYSARLRSQYVKQAAQELEIEEDVVKSDLGKVLFKLEGLQEEHLRTLTTPKDQAVQLTEAEEKAALELLRDPKLLDRILKDFERCGVVGEEVNKLTAFIAGVSRKLDDPLAIIIQSSSAAGKTSLMEAVLAFMPEEDRVKYSAMTGQSLFYMGESNLKHKILAIVEEEGAERASYALKLLQSEKELTIASTGKDPETGRLITHEYRVEGPVMIFLTTTAIEIDEELLNRAIILTVDENRAQTQAIHRLQRHRETLEGVLERHDRSAVLKLHQNAQRLLKPIRVANPFAERLSFVDTRTRTRRDHMKYLVLIRAIALLHQHQRPLKTIRHQGEVLDYLEVTTDDIALANKIAHEVLGRSLDELAPQTRRFLGTLHEMVGALEREQSLPRKDVRFSRRQVSELAGWSYDQIRVHLTRLIDLELVLIHGGRRGQSFVYELLWDGKGQDGGAFLAGLTDLDALLRMGAEDRGLVGANPEFGGALGAHRGPNGAPSGVTKTQSKPRDAAVLEKSSGASAKNARPAPKANGHHGRAPLGSSIARPS